MKWLTSLLSVAIIFQLLQTEPPIQLSPLVSVEMITAHRGSSANAPENTRSAIALAIEEKAGLIEIDVRMTADGIVVLSHDDSLKRMGNSKLFISKSTYQEIKQIHVGAGFGPDYRSETIPTLVEMMDLVRDKAKLNIEIKMDGSRPELAHAVAQLILEEDFVEHCIVTSFQKEAIQTVKQLIPEQKVGLIIGSPAALSNDVYTDPMIDILSLRSSIISRAIVTHAHANDKQVHAWTVDQPREMQRVIRAGVDSIITNKPQLLFNVLF